MYVVLVISWCEHCSIGNTGLKNVFFKKIFTHLQK